MATKKKLTPEEIKALKIERARLAEEVFIINRRGTIHSVTRGHFEKFEYDPKKSMRIIKKSDVGVFNEKKLIGTDINGKKTYSHRQYLTLKKNLKEPKPEEKKA